MGCVKQHKKFLKSTISGWVKKIPKQPRINVEYFKSVSKKSDSISKAALFNNFEKLIFLNVSQKTNTIIDKQMIQIKGSTNKIHFKCSLSR